MEKTEEKKGERANNWKITFSRCLDEKIISDTERKANHIRQNKFTYKCAHVYKTDFTEQLNDFHFLLFIGPLKVMSVTFMSD